MGTRHLSSGWGWIVEPTCCDGCGDMISPFERSPGIVARFDSHDDDGVIECFDTVYCDPSCVPPAIRTPDCTPPPWVREWYGDVWNDDDMGVPCDDDAVAF